MYVTIDPGNQTGWAIWNVNGLVACGLGDPRSSSKHRVTGDSPDVDTIVDAWVESQVIYPRSPVPPNDVVTLAHEAGRWCGRYDVLGVEAHLVKPAEWKGQLPKDVCHARMWAALTPDEAEVVHASLKGVAPKKRHNVLDAIAFGLWVATRHYGR